MTLREEVSALLGVRVEKGKYRPILKYLDKSGGVNQRVLFDLLLIVCQRLEALEENGKQ